MIPCLLMRGGTSRGTYFLKEHLPRYRETLDKVLLQVMGSPDPHQIDGVGGATATTSKVAVLSRSREPGIDIDFLFAQVSVTTAMVDWGPTCGNILAGVGPAAVEMGLIPNVDNAETKVRIRLVNTGGFVEAVVKTPGGQVTYEGDAAIDGVPGTSAPIELNCITGMVRVPSTFGLDTFTQSEEFREMSEQFFQLYRPRKMLPLKLRGKSLPRSPRALHSSRAVSTVNIASPRASEMRVILVQAIAVPAVRCAHQVGVGTRCRSPSGFL